MTDKRITPPQADSQFAQRHPAGFLSAYAVAGALAVIVLVTVFLFIGHAIPMQDALTRADRAVNAWMESHGTETGETVFTAVSYIGAPLLAATVLITLVALARRRDWFHVWAVALVTGGGLLLSTILKFTFHRARPLTAAEFMTHPSYSFPSGHAMNSMITYGFLAFLLLARVQELSRRLLIILVALIVIGAIGFSRVYLGVHFVSDVVGGWLAGTAWLIVGVGGYRFAQQRLSRAQTNGTHSG